MTINELRAIVPETLWDTPIAIEYSESGELRRAIAVPVRSVKVDTAARDKIVLVPIPYFFCPRCHRISFHPTDVVERYCGACHIFFS